MENVSFNRELSVWFAEQFAREREVALAQPIAKANGITVQAANARLRKLVAQKILDPRLRGRRKLYRLRPLHYGTMSFERARLEEDRVWSGFILPFVQRYAEPNAIRVLEYGTTEMLNNAKDHSEGSKVDVDVSVDIAFTTIVISDDGEGIFARIKRLCGLHDERESLLELAKGKLTTDPERHSGEGVFFSSRALDEFTIYAGGLSFSHVRGQDDYLIEGAESLQGTQVVMRHAHTSQTDLKQVFDEYAAPDEYTFSKTVVPLRLAVFGNDNLMSRSQAKRVLSRVEKFQTVILDFSGVEFVGQAFADEVFRVFARQHPEMEIIPIHTNSDIGQMIARASAGRTAHG